MAGHSTQDTFDFTGLPGHLGIGINALVLADDLQTARDGTFNLGIVTPPSITLASKQIQQEAL